MKFAQLKKIIDNVGLSPEQLAPIIGVSNMTIRRWKKERPSKQVPKAYELLLAGAIQQMVIEEKLSVESPEIAMLLGRSWASSIRVALKMFGTSEYIVGEESDHRGRLLRFLLSVGLSERYDVAHKGGARGVLPERMQVEWRRVRSELTNVLNQNELTESERLVAYGALLFLLYPLDLIQEGIPTLGVPKDLQFLAAAAQSNLKKKSQISNGKMGLVREVE